MRLLELGTRRERVHGRAHDHCIGDETVVVVLGQVAARLDAAQRSADEEDLVADEFGVHVTQHEVDVLVVGRTIGARRGQLGLDAAIVHHDGHTRRLVRLVHNVRHVVALRRARQAGQHEDDELIGRRRHRRRGVVCLRRRTRPVERDRAAVVEAHKLALVVHLGALLDEG